MDIHSQPVTPATMWDEVTAEILVRECASDRTFAALVAEVAATELETCSVMVALRRRGHGAVLITRDRVEAPSPPVAAEVADRLLDAAFDDHAVVAVCQAALPGRTPLRHTVAFDPDSVPVAAMAVFANGGDAPPPAAVSAILRRGTDALAAWVGVPVRNVNAAQALLDLSDDCALVHDRGVIVMANAAAARVLGASSIDDLVGQDLARYVPMTPTRFGDMLTEVRGQDGRRCPASLRAIPLALGGRERRALLIRCARVDAPARSTALRPSMERAFCGLHPLLHESARLTLAVGDGAMVRGDEAAIGRLTTAMLLDAACFLECRGPGDANEVAITVEAEEQWIVIELVAQATAGGDAAQPVEPFGIAVARDVLRSLGGEIRAETSPSGRRRRLVACLPRADRSGDR